MEGNACYKYYTIRRFVDAQKGPPIRTILEVGANVGDITIEMAKCFPEARIVSYEPVERYAQKARSKTQGLKQVQIRSEAVTAAHLYQDDFGEVPRGGQGPLHVYLGLPDGGPGYEGGSFIAPAGVASGGNHKELADTVACKTLEEALNDIVNEGEELDYLKTDSEGAECSFLGSASEKTLKRIRFMAGEYHDIKRFWPIMQKLMSTHYVNIVGAADLGSFFCERITDGPSILSKTAIKPRHYPHLAGEVMWWHPFGYDWLEPIEFRDHGLIHAAYLVCGPVASGNRLMASILLRSGCIGFHGDEQPQREEEILVSKGEPFVMVQHGNIVGWVGGLRRAGYSHITGVVMIREPIAAMRSAIKKHGFTNDLGSMLGSRNRTLVRNITELKANGAEVEIVPYEGLCEEGVKLWLPHIGLKYHTGTLHSPVGDTIVDPQEKNKVYYEDEDAA